MLHGAYRARRMLKTVACLSADRDRRLADSKHIQHVELTGSERYAPALIRRCESHGKSVGIFSAHTSDLVPAWEHRIALRRQGAFIFNEVDHSREAEAAWLAAVEA